jgi:predicted SprT family Zn-dependent metalloprotease
MSVAVKWSDAFVCHKCGQKLIELRKLPEDFWSFVLRCPDCDRDLLEEEIG